jgi:hypothetical protein
MNYMRTAVLLAGLTGLFMAVGYLIGGGGGALIALIIAAGPICSATGMPTSSCSQAVGAQSPNLSGIYQCVHHCAGERFWRIVARANSHKRNWTDLRGMD